MRDVLGALRQRDACKLALAARIEQAQLDARRAAGIDREIDALAGPGRAERFGRAGWRMTFVVGWKWRSSMHMLTDASGLRSSEGSDRTLVSSPRLLLHDLHPCTSPCGQLFSCAKRLSCRFVTQPIVTAIAISIYLGVRSGAIQNSQAPNIRDPCENCGLEPSECRRLIWRRIVLLGPVFPSPAPTRGMKLARASASRVRDMESDRSFVSSRARGQSATRSQIVTARGGRSTRICAGKSCQPPRSASTSTCAEKPEPAKAGASLSRIFR